MDLKPDYFLFNQDHDWEKKIFDIYMSSRLELTSLLNS